MGDTVPHPLGPPAGFPNCATCAYLANGPIAVCAHCATSAIVPILRPHCPICSQELPSSGSCDNSLCRRPRSVTRIRAIAQYTGTLSGAIKALKYDGKWRWAYIFGRLVTGYLDANVPQDGVDLIVPNPTWGVPDDQVPHTEGVLRAARAEDVLQRWPFRPDGVLIKIGSTPRSAGMSAYDKRAAAKALMSVLRVPDPAQIVGRRIVVYDDVCTTGSQLDAIAEFLVKQGARSVEGLVLARMPWR